MTRSYLGHLVNSPEDMARFVTLPDRTVNVAIIKQLSKGMGSFNDPEDRDFDPRQIYKPSIFLQLVGGKKPLVYPFDTQEACDTEYERIQASLASKPLVLFKNLFLDPALIESMLVEWQGSSADALKLRIKVAGTASFAIVVHQYEEEDWARAHDLIAQLGLSLPTTASEHMKEIQKKGFGTFSGAR